MTRRPGRPADPPLVNGETLVSVTRSGHHGMAVLVPMSVLRALGVTVGDRVIFRAFDGTITLEPASLGSRIAGAAPERDGTSARREHGPTSSDTAGRGAGAATGTFSPGDGLR